MNQDIGLSRGGKNTKTHAVIDALLNPVKLCLTPGNTDDNIVAVEILSSVTPTGSAVLADKTYGTVDIINHIDSRWSIYPICTHLMLPSREKYDINYSWGDNK